MNAELAEVMAEFKTRAAAAQTPEDMWAVREYLWQKQRVIEEKYDYRYNQLIFVFARLVHEGRLQEGELSGLSEEKRRYINGILAL